MRGFDLATQVKNTERGPHGSSTINALSARQVISKAAK